MFNSSPIVTTDTSLNIVLDYIRITYMVSLDFTNHL